MSEYQAQNVLLTGVCGFIGSAVTRYLVQKYKDISFFGIDKISYCSNTKNLTPIESAENFTFIKADICNLDFMQHIMFNYNIDTVIHLAAYSHVDHSFGNSLTFTQNNVVGTHTLLEASKINGIKRFIHVSTDEVYGDNDDVSNENTVLDPTNPYSASKAAAEQQVRAYHHSYNLPIIITRGNNVYGPYQYPEKAIPRFILRIKSNMQCQIQGSGQQTRSFMYIDDVVSAFETILFKGQIGETYNIGINQEYSINDIARRIITTMMPGADAQQWIENVTDRDFNDQRYNISSQKLEALGWSAKTGLDQGLQQTINWYCENSNHWSSDDLASSLNLDHRTVL